MDPIGLALENFDAIGRWRAQRRRHAGRSARRAVRRHARSTARSACAQALLGHADAFRAGFAENLLSYALGRVLDTPTCRRCAPSRARRARDQDRFSSFVMAVVTSGPFQMRTLAPDAPRRSPAQERKGVH